MTKARQVGNVIGVQM